MKSADELKNIVKDKYGEIARQGGSCCGPSGCCDSLGGTSFAEDYRGLDGYFPEADLGLGCGIPTEFAGIETGQTVIDLGSGAGNDVFVVRALVGDTGRVIGLDMVPEMVDKAKTHAAKLQYENVEFHLGEIENMPLDSDLADVLVSNCVLNLVPDKGRAFAEIQRVLKPGGHFSISDIVLEGQLPAELEAAAVAYVGCVAGALQQQDYLETITAAGFKDLQVLKTKQITLPGALLEDILGPDGTRNFLDSGVRILSITVRAQKP